MEPSVWGCYKKAGSALETAPLGALITMLHISLGAALASLVVFTSSNTANALNNGVAKLPSRWST